MHQRGEGEEKRKRLDDHDGEIQARLAAEKSFGGGKGAIDRLDLKNNVFMGAFGQDKYVSYLAQPIWANNCRGFR